MARPPLLCKEGNTLVPYIRHRDNSRQRPSNVCGVLVQVATPPPPNLTFAVDNCESQASVKKITWRPKNWPSQRVI